MTVGKSRLPKKKVAKTMSVNRSKRSITAGSCSSPIEELTPISSLNELKEITKQLLALEDNRSIGALSIEDEQHLDALGRLVDEYENRKYGHPEKLSPPDFLRALMKLNDLKQADLANELGGQSRVSDFLNGKRELSIQQIRNLSNRFLVSTDAFIDGLLINER